LEKYTQQHNYTQLMAVYAEALVDFG
jgi:hypothetical protein